MELLPLRSAWAISSTVVFLKPKRLNIADAVSIMLSRISSFSDFINAALHILLFDHLSISVERYNIMNVKCKFLTENRKRRKRRNGRKWRK